MVKHNNVVPNAHFHKYWQKHVHTWFDQPGKKVKRRNARVAKAKRLAPRPLNLLRPIVRAQTIKYNSKVRAGRGFTIDEIQAAGFRKKEARTIGIAVDHRRKNKSEEAFNLNVDRLKLYKSKLVIFPRKNKKSKDEATAEELKKAKQVTLKTVLPISPPLPKIRARKITAEEKDAVVTKVLRKALTDGKLWGVREKRQKDKESGILSSKKKEKGGKGGKGDDGGAEEEEVGGDEE